MGNLSSRFSELAGGVEACVNLRKKRNNASLTRSRELHQQALTALETFDDKADTLRDIANYIVDRVR